jgi:sodium-dependent dicarboxylate transporter 2/3/5
MSKLLESPDAGIFQSILTILTPLANTLGSTGFVICVAFLLFLVTQISHNIVLARLVIPLIIPLGMSLNISPLLMLSSIIIPLQMAFCTPSASANVALIWGNQQWITKEAIIKMSLICAVLVLLYNNLVIIPISFMLYQ